MLNAFYHLLIRDLRLALRSPHELANPLIFFVLVVSLFPLAVSPTTEALRAMAPGVIWVSALLAVLLSLDRLFKQDYDDGSLDQLMLSPNPLVILVFAKVTAHWLLTGLPLVIIAPLLGLFMSLPAEAVKVLVYSLLLGTPVLSLIGAIGVSLTVAVNRGGVLLSLIILPLYIPILIFGANAVDVAIDGLSVKGQLLFLASMLALAASLAPLATSVALRITASR
jgi:heme exporter protein B